MIMDDTTQIVDAPQPGSAIAEKLEHDVQRLIDLRQQRELIDEEIKRIVGRVRNPIIHRNPNRPTWGPCTRCGHTWLGMWPDQPPVGCPRCGSTGWRWAPRKAGARTPSDPPNPRWAERRAAADRKLLRERKVRPERKLQERTERKREREQQTSLAPPPKFEDVSRSGLVLVPPPQVRFAEPRVAPDPMRTVSVDVSREPDKAVATVWEGEKIVDQYEIVGDEPYEAVEGDGWLVEEDADGNYVE